MSLDKRSIELGDGQWAVKEDKLFAFRKDRDKFFERSFDFSRASGGTVVNKDGFIEQAGLTSNQIVSPLLSEIPDTPDATTLDDFSAYGNPIERSITDGKLVIEASGGNQGIIYSPTYDIGKVYLVRFFAEGDTSNVYISTGGSATTIASGPGWTEAIVSFSVSNITINFRTNNNNAGRTVYSSFTITEINPDQPRIDYLNNPDGHLLLEPQSTNYALGLQPDDWHSSNNVDITRNAIQAPSGLEQASLVVTNDPSGASAYSRQNINFSSGSGTQVVTVSVFFKYYNNQWVYIRPMFFNGAATDEQRTWFDIQNGVIGTNNNEDARIESYGNGWYRCSVTFTIDKSTDTNGYVHIYGVNDDNSQLQTLNKGYYAYGMQGEELSYPTSYIPVQAQPNTAFGRTRTDETANNSGNVGDFNSEEGVLFAELDFAPSSTNDMVVSLYGGSPYVYLATDANANLFKIRLSTASSNRYVGAVGDGFTRIAIKYDGTNIVVFRDGESVYTAAASSFTANSLNSLNFDRGDSGQPFYGKVKALKVYTETLNDAELRLLTKYAPRDYDVAFTADYVDTVAEINILRTEATDKLYYVISDGTNEVSGSATITATEVTISNIDISSLNDGTLTVSVYIEDERKQRGVTVTDTTIKDTTNTPLYSYALQQRATGAIIEELDNAEAIIESLNVEV